jgi:hypothetical protein
VILYDGVKTAQKIAGRRGEIGARQDLVPEADKQGLIGRTERVFGESFHVHAMFSIKAGLTVTDVDDQSETQREIGSLAEEADRLKDAVFENFDFIAPEIRDDLAAGIVGREGDVHEADVDSYRRRGVLAEE